MEMLVQKFGDSLIKVIEDDGSESKKLIVNEVMGILTDERWRCEAAFDMPLRDAVDYVHFLIYSTIKFKKFQAGAPVCSGFVELAAITLDRGFRRIRRKKLDYCISGGV